MTRKKWNRLRRQRPELFGALPSYCHVEHRVREFSKAEAIARVSAWVLEHGPIVITLSHPVGFFIYNIFTKPPHYPVDEDYIM